MSKIEATHITTKTVGYKCDICGDVLLEESYARLINETEAEWFQADFCQVCYDKVKDCVIALGGKIEDRW